MPWPGQSGGAPPDSFLLAEAAVFLAAPVVSAAAPKCSDGSLFAAVVVSADAAPDQRGELGSLAPGACILFKAACIFGLHGFKHFPADDGFVIVLYEILRQLTTIPFADLGNVVGDIGLLKKQVADVLLIAKNALNRCCGLLSA